MSWLAGRIISFSRRTMLHRISYIALKHSWRVWNINVIIFFYKMCCYIDLRISRLGGEQCKIITLINQSLWVANYISSCKNYSFYGTRKFITVFTRAHPVSTPSKTFLTCCYFKSEGLLALRSTYYRLCLTAYFIFKYPLYLMTVS